jgi:dolichyl-phosphate-mannose--protein O-mannosyl transferase
MDTKHLEVSWLWRLRLLLVGGASFFVMLLGINTLFGAYLLKNPIEFIMLFFSASFMILLGITGLIYIAFQIRAVLRNDGKV